VGVVTSDSNKCAWATCVLFGQGVYNPFNLPNSVPLGGAFNKFLIGKCTLRAEVTNQNRDYTIATCYYLSVRRATARAPFDSMYGVEGNVGATTVDAYDSPFDSKQFPIFYKCHKVVTRKIHPGQSHVFKLMNTRGKTRKGSMVRLIDFSAPTDSFLPGMQQIMYIKVRQALGVQTTVDAAGTKPIIAPPVWNGIRLRYDYQWKQIQDPGFGTVRSNEYTAVGPIRQVTAGEFNPINPLS
jgi:hypothetical protein